MEGSTQWIGQWTGVGGPTAHEMDQQHPVDRGWHPVDTKWWTQQAPGRGRNLKGLFQLPVPGLRKAQTYVHKWDLWARQEEVGLKELEVLARGRER